jgi:hypothetical protein
MTADQLANALDQHDQLHRLYLEIRYELSKLERPSLVEALSPAEQEEWAERVAAIYDLIEPTPCVLRPIRLPRELADAEAYAACLREALA